MIQQILTVANCQNLLESILKLYYDGNLVEVVGWSREQIEQWVVNYHELSNV